MTNAEDSKEGTGETGANPATGGRATEIAAKRFAPDLESKIATQKRINELEHERNHRKRTLHDAPDAIEQKKDTLWNRGFGSKPPGSRCLPCVGGYNQRLGLPDRLGPWLARMFRSGRIAV